MPLLWLSLVFIAGIGAANWLNWPVLAWAVLTGIALFLLGLNYLLARRFQNLPVWTARLPNPENFPASYIPIFLLAFSFTLGGLRYQMVQPRWERGFIAQYNDLETNYTIQGVVARPPDVRDRYTQLTIQSEKIRPVDGADDAPVSGLLLARLALGGDWQYGDRVSIQGVLETPPEDEAFSYKDYLARQGVYSYITYASASLVERGQGNRLLAGLYALRQRGLDSLYSIFPDPEASLLAGILLGVDTNIPASVTQAFQDSGTSHIIAISGFNMAIVAGLFATLFGRLLGKRRGAIASVTSITLYTLLVGAGPSVVRAAIMAGLAVFAAQVGRRQSGLNTLAITAAVMAFFNPNVLWDVSFQLTFMATLGLVLYAGPLMDAFARLAGRFIPDERAQKLSQPVGEYFLFTLAAMALTLPVTIYYFRQFPLAGLLANPLILPVQPAVMVLGGIAMLLGMFFQPLGQFAAYLAWPFVAYTIRMAEFWAQFQGSIIHFGQTSSLAVAVFYLLIFALTFGVPVWRKRRLAAQTAVQANPQTSRLAGFKAWLKHTAQPLLALALAGLAVVAVLFWQAGSLVPDGRLHLTVLNVGSGDGILIQTPSGRSILIDGGSSATALSDALGRRLPLGRRSLDYLIVAGTDDDQVGALPRTLERYPAANVLWAGPTGATRGARLLREYLTEEKIPVIEAQTRQVLDLGDGATLKVLSANPRGAVLLLEWGSFRALLPVSMDRTALKTLQDDASLAQVTALLLSDGGYAPANPPEWIARLRPQVVLLSVAAGDRRNLPDAETLQAVGAYTLLRTDQNGWIELVTDGDQLSVDVEKR